MKKLTTKELAMFYGCMAEVNLGTNKWFNVPIDHKLLEKNERVSDLQVKPILRPFSDVTVEESLELFKVIKYFADGTGEKYINDRIYLIKDDYLPGGKFTPEVLQYLTTRGFDVFGWIPLELAITHKQNITTNQL